MLKFSMPATALTTAAFLAMAGAASPGAAQAPPAPASDPTADQIASWIAGQHGEVQGVDSTAPDGAPVRDGRVHGVVGAAIGSGGYRSGYGVATMPLGQRGDVTVSISDEHLGRGARAYGPGGYGYGGYGYGGERRTFSLGVDLTGQDRRQRCDAADPTPHWGPQGGALDDPCRNRAPSGQPER